MRFGPRTDAPSPFMVGLGGKEVLLRGQIADFGDDARQPRTVIGFSGDRATMFLVTVDRRQHDSSGMTLRELAELLISLGAAEATWQGTRAATAQGRSHARLSLEHPGTLRRSRIVSEQARSNES